MKLAENWIFLNLKLKLFSRNKFKVDKIKKLSQIEQN